MSKPKDDLISRSAAIEELMGWVDHEHEVIHWTGIKAMLECLPSVDAVPVVEPRVMTLEEIRMANGGDVWLELSGNIAEDVIFAATIDGCGTKGVSTRYEALDYKMYGVKPYGWRCWASRSSDEVRRVTPWN